LTINGLPVAPNDFLADGGPVAPDTAYEPFDARKRQRVADLITQEEKLLEDVASLKRAVPAKAAAEHVDRLREGVKRDDELAAARIAQGSGEEEASLQGVGRLERQQRVESSFNGAVETLERLKTDMSTVVAKMERAKVAGEYVVNDKR
jgi:kinetochor protein Mis14/NSL1